MNTFNLSVPESLNTLIAQHISAAGGWLAFDAFMHAALYTPGLGYYASESLKIGSLPTRVAANGWAIEGSDFVTAPELSPLFGQCVGAQVAQALRATGTRCVVEFGAGSGALALQIGTYLMQTGVEFDTYFIVEVSSSLRARQQAKLAHWGQRVQWLSCLPESIEGVLLGNEVLDAMPVKLLARKGGVWHERGVALCVMHDTQRHAQREASPNATPNTSPWTWQDRPTDLRPALHIPGNHDYLTEIAPQAQAFIATVAAHLTRGAAFFIDYGFPEAEYYHSQRHMGTLMCHYQHQADPNPLDKVGHKDITAHVNFTAVALAGQDAGLDVLGYATQGRFLMNCGLLTLLEQLTPLQRAHTAKLVNEHEMGELFKVIAFGKGANFEPIGFADGDRMHTL